MKQAERMCQKPFILFFSYILTACSPSTDFSKSLGSTHQTSNPPDVPSTILVAGVPYTYFTSEGSADGMPGQFNLPSGIALDSNYYYIGDGGNSTVRRVSRNTGAVDTIAGTAGVSGSANGNGTAATFSWPIDLLLSGTTLYVADLAMSCIRAIDISNPVFPVTTVLGLCGTTGVTDSTGTAARFNQPTGMEKVGGFLYITDSGNQTIRQVDLSNMSVTTVAGTVGSPGTTDAAGTSAQFNSPYNLAYYDDMTDGDVLFITDNGNDTVRRMRLSDFNVTTVAGIAGSPGLVDDDSGLSAQFNSPWGIATDSTYIYVGDTGNLSVRKIRLSDYAVSTYFGDPTVTTDNFGPLTTTTLSSLSTLYYDSQLGLIGTTFSALFRVVP